MMDGFLIVVMALVAAMFALPVGGCMSDYQTVADCAESGHAVMAGKQIINCSVRRKESK